MYTTEHIAAVLKRLQKAVSGQREALCQMDGKAGDGDLGFSMESAMAAMAQVPPDAEVGRYFLQLAAACGKAAPSTMGTLLSGGLMALGRTYKGCTALRDRQVVAIPRLLADAVAGRGGAKRGDKTILDALYPMAEAAESAASDGLALRDCFQAAAQAAEQGARSTAGMPAAVGRARWIGERGNEYPDAGAMLCAMLARSALDTDGHA